MKRIAALLCGLSLAVPLAIGCSEETEYKKTETIETPDVTTTRTTTTNVETTGDHAPAVP